MFSAIIFHFGITCGKVISFIKNNSKRSDLIRGRGNISDSAGAILLCVTNDMTSNPV